MFINQPVIRNGHRRRLFKIRPTSSARCGPAQCIAILTGKFSKIRKLLKMGLTCRRANSKAKDGHAFTSMPAAAQHCDNPHRAARFERRRHGVYSSTVASYSASNSDLTGITLVPELAHLSPQAKSVPAGEKDTLNLAPQPDLPIDFLRRSYAKTPVYEIGQLEALRTRRSVSPCKVTNAALLAASYHALLESPFSFFIRSPSVCEVERFAWETSIESSKNLFQSTTDLQTELSLMINGLTLVEWDEDVVY